jgi:hypothetical protein
LLGNNLQITALILVQIISYNEINLQQKSTTKSITVYAGDRELMFEIAMW